MLCFPMDENGEPASDDVYLYRYHDDGDEPEIEYIDDEDDIERRIRLLR